MFHFYICSLSCSVRFQPIVNPNSHIRQKQSIVIKISMNVNNLNCSRIKKKKKILHIEPSKFVTRLCSRVRQDSWRVQNHFVHAINLQLERNWIKTFFSFDCMCSLLHWKCQIKLMPSQIVKFIFLRRHLLNNLELIFSFDWATCKKIY